MSRKPYKVVTIGNSGVGKTSLIIRAVHGKFNTELNATIGASYETYRAIVDNKIIELNIWDTAGQERYQSLIPLYLRGALAILIVIDVSIPEPLEGIGEYFETVKNSVPKCGLIYLVANKSDIFNQSLSSDLIETISAEYDVPYFIVSASS